MLKMGSALEGLLSLLLLLYWYFEGVFYEVDGAARAAGTAANGVLPTVGKKTWDLTLSIGPVFLAFLF
jgi:hypothetical protein